MAEEKTLTLATTSAITKAVNNNQTMARFVGMLGERQAKQFTSALVSIVTNDPYLQKCEVGSVLRAANAVATMNLPITPSLGMGGVIPYYNNSKGIYEAQVQVYRNGYVELAQRSGQLAALVNEPVHEGELVSCNKFRDEYIFDESKRTSDKIIGYMAYARTITGFEKTIYMTREECYEHAKHYSDTFKKGKGKWKTDFDAMALKTVLRKLIIKYLPKSTEMQAAISYDQATMSGDFDTPTPNYVDNQASEQPAQETPVEVINVEAVEVEDVNAVKQ